MTINDNQLDNILEKIGNFGKYQCRITILILIAITMTSFPTGIWLFETKQVNYRCEIPGCEMNHSQFKPFWWPYAIPSLDDEPEQCVKYKKISNSSQHLCGQSDFNIDIQETCVTYVYETPEVTILQDFDLHCHDNFWKLTTVGTVNSIGLFIGLPIAGILSDKYGRKTILIGTMTLSGLSGLIRSFANTYILFLSMKLIDSICTAGSYAVCFTLAIEIFVPNKRMFIASVLACFYSLGMAILCGVAWLLQSWRPLVRILYGLQLLIIFFYWLLPESVRWSLDKKKYQDVQNTLLTMAKANGKSITDEDLQIVCHSDNGKIITSTVYPLKELFQSFTLTKRFIICCICWILIAFLYQGLSVYSLVLSTNNGYLDFILTSIVEIPGSFATYILVDRIGRRLVLSISLLLSATSCVCSSFIPANLYWLKLSLHLMGKFGATIACNVIYIVTSEIFPTPLRNSLLSICSMFGSVGSIIAPQIPLLEKTWQLLPLVLFGLSSFIGSVLCLLFPETVRTKLPDTVMEAENIGKKTNVIDIKQVVLKNLHFPKISDRVFNIT